MNLNSRFEMKLNKHRKNKKKTLKIREKKGVKSKKLKLEKSFIHPLSLMNFKSLKFEELIKINYYYYQLLTDHYKSIIKSIKK